MAEHYQPQFNTPQTKQKQHAPRATQLGIHEAAEKLMRYQVDGVRFDRKAVYQVLRETGTDDLQTALRILAQRARAGQRPATSRPSRGEVSPPTEPSEESSSEESEPEEEEEEEAHGSNMRVEEQVVVEAVSEVEQMEQTEEAAVAEARVRTDAILTEAAQLKAPNLNRARRLCKMLHGVPMDIVVYEEGLLRLQMKLDNITANDDASSEARLAIRNMRRGAVRAIQEELDHIDAVRGWWLQQESGPEPPAAHAAGTPVAVA